MRRIVPKLDILPKEQRALWPSLAGLAALGFVLYGGTSIALQLGHRESVDFDFFHHQPLDRPAILAAFPALRTAKTLQDQPDSWTALVGANPPVKISIFGGIGFGRVGAPAQTEDGVVILASLRDLLATKLKVLLQRVEAKDYRDIAALISAGLDLSAGLADARALFGPQFQPSESLKALVYFEGGDLHTLSATERDALSAAVMQVRELPNSTIVASALGETA